jgi:glutamine kinase
MLSKAETLIYLSQKIESGKILPIQLFTIKDWITFPEQILNEVLNQKWSKQALIVRSSSRNEDATGASLAGHYCSVLNVQGQEALKRAITQVAESLNGSEQDQIFVQPMLTEIAFSGVAFSADPSTGTPCLVFNYQDHSEDTTAVTGGQSNDLHTWYYYFQNNPIQACRRFKPLFDLVNELQTLLPYTALDLEVACQKDGSWFLFQVRPLIVDKQSSSVLQFESMQKIASFLQPMQSVHPFLYGKRTVYGVMPDWNPAEIIGIRPRPLALSLYQELITDSIWAYQRDNYGYRNLRSFPLMINLGGCPYIDVRVSFNSFIPASLPSGLAEKLADYYLERLLKTPSYHDKVEFEIIFSCYTLNLPERLNILRDWGFLSEESDLLAHSLRSLTNRIIHRETGLLKRDLARLGILQARREQLLASDLKPINRIYWLLEDCKRYGTLPFAGLARAGFIAVQMLDSMVQIGVLSAEERACFMQSLDTISSRIQRDYYQMERSTFFETYGHLRPGTYDILSLRYDQAPDLYFGTPQKPDSAPAFSLRLDQLKLIRQYLQQHELELDVLELFDFIKEAIEGREYAKFLFTCNLSDALEEIAQLGLSQGFSREECSFLNIQNLRKLNNSSYDLQYTLAKSIDAGKADYALTKSLVLPPLITHPDDIWQFELQPGEPNFVTLKRAQGPVIFSDAPVSQLAGAILLIPSADPGYDWIFSHPIAGLITLYGGGNSHMAIRSGEMGIPAVIGAGEVLYQQWAKASVLELNCATRQVLVLA